MRADYTIFIGRLQPFHNGHKIMVDTAISEGQKTIVVLGSANEARSTQDPFTSSERQNMIEAVYPDEGLLFIHLPDSNYNNFDWAEYLKEEVYKLCSPEDNIKLIGHNKDSSSFYLRLFPEWDYLEVPLQENGLSATEVRQHFFESKEYWKEFVPKGITKWLEENWIDTAEDEYLLNWWRAVQDKYIIPWKGSPYTPTFNAGDAVVFCNDHVLLIKRGEQPGLDQLAVSGGFLEPDESLRTCALRELNEEGGIDVTTKILQSSITESETFDYSKRDTRGRIISKAFVVKLEGYEELPNIKAGDDAKECFWYPIKDLPKLEGMFYADHLRIIRYFLKIKLSRA